MTGAFFRPGDWYERLKKPTWRPPNRLFAPIWTVLYVMIAVSGWLVWREVGFVGAALPLAVYAIQLVLTYVREFIVGEAAERMVAQPPLPIFVAS